MCTLIVHAHWRQLYCHLLKYLANQFQLTEHAVRSETFCLRFTFYFEPAMASSVVRLAMPCKPCRQPIWLPDYPNMNILILELHFPAHLTYCMSTGKLLLVKSFLCGCSTTLSKLRVCFWRSILLIVRGYRDVDGEEGPYDREWLLWPRHAKERYATKIPETSKVKNAGKVKTWSSYR